MNTSKKMFFFSYIQEVILSESRYGRPVLIVDGQRFNIYAKNGPKSVWRCVKWWKMCRARIITYNDQIICKRENHNHF